MCIVGAHLLAVVTYKFHDCRFGYTGFLHHRDSGVAQRVEAQACPSGGRTFWLFSSAFLPSSLLPQTSLGHEVSELLRQCRGFVCSRYAFKSATVNRAGSSIAGVVEFDVCEEGGSDGNGDGRGDDKNGNGDY